jgi:hypothetical protein
MVFLILESSFFSSPESSLLSDIILIYFHLFLIRLASFLLYHLASNMDKQEKLRQELEEVLGPTGRITEASHPNLKYLKV